MWSNLQIKISDSPILVVWFTTILLMYMVISFNIFAFLQPVSYLVLGFCLLDFLVLSYFFLQRMKVSYYGFIVFLYMIFLLIMTIFNLTDIKTSIYNFVVIMTLLMLFAYYDKQHKLILVTTAVFLSVCVYANLALMILFPDWIFMTEVQDKDSFLLGGNYNQMGCRFVLALIVSVMCAPYGKKWKINTVCISLVSIITLILVGSMTALANIILLSVLFLIPSKKILKVTLACFFVFYLFFQCVVCFTGEGLHNNELAVYIIEDLLGKELTFTNRTEMWDSAAKVFAESPIFGYGMVDAEWYLTNMNSSAIGPHNFIYALLIYGGIIGLALFVTIAVFAIKRIFAHLDRTALLLLLGTQTLFFIMCFEVFHLFFPITLFCLAYNYESFYCKPSLEPKHE